MTWDEFQQGVSDLYKEEQGEVTGPQSCSVCHQDLDQDHGLSYFCMDCWETQGEVKEKIVSECTCRKVDEPDPCLVCCLRSQIDAIQEEQGEDKVEIVRLQQDVDHWVTTGTSYFDEIVALKRERAELKNERDTWRARHQALKSAIGTATQASSLDATTYG